MFIAIFFLYLFFLLQWKFPPYIHSNLNSAELASQFSSLLIMVLLLISCNFLFSSLLIVLAFSQQENEYPKISYFISTLICLLILSFYLQIIFVLIPKWYIFKRKQNSKHLKSNISDKNKRDFQASIFFEKRKNINRTVSETIEKQKEGEKYFSQTKQGLIRNVILIFLLLQNLILGIS